MRNLSIFILILSFASCRTTRSTTQTKTVVDSTVVAENRMLKESINEMSKTIEKLTLDSQAVIVEFDTLYRKDTVTVVEFKEGRIVRVQGPVRRIVTKDSHTERVNDSLYTMIQIKEDSLNYYKAQKSIVAESKTKDVKRGWGWWIWLCIGIAGGLAVRHFWPWIKRKFKL